MAQDPPKPREPFVKIDPRWWSLGVVDAFHGRAPQRAVTDQLSYASGRVEGEAAREQGRTIDQVLVKCRSPYREAHFRPTPVVGVLPKRRP